MWGRFAAAVAMLFAGILLSVVVGAGQTASGESTSWTTPTTTTTTEGSTTETTTATTASTTTVTPHATTAGTRATIASTSSTTTAARTPVKTARRARVAGAAVRPLGATCAAAAVELQFPRREPLALVRRSRLGGRPSGLLTYPAGGGAIMVHSLNVVERCPRRRQPRASIAIRSLSLFGGAVTADGVSIRVRGRLRSRVSIHGLRVFGRPAPPRTQHTVLAHWGSLTVGRSLIAGRGTRRRVQAAVVIHLLRARAGLPAGTTLRIAFVALQLPRAAARPIRRKHSRPLGHGPLKLTPDPGLRGYVFPVAGASSFSDSYGGFRADVSGNWHHGDDVFAAIGTPVVAVATGTVNRVGWERIGGWRLWVRDRRGNEFYYAHLSGYSPKVLRTRRVRAGEVLGFVGNSGDAFTTPFHLHFEVHPRHLLYLHYDGAVDPTTYLDHWSHLKVTRAPRPTLPALPAGNPGHEARFVFGELLAARGLTRHAPTTPPRIRVPGHDVATRPFTTALAHEQPGGERHRVPFVPLTLALVFALSAGVAAALIRRRRDAAPGAVGSNDA